MSATLKNIYAPAPFTERAKSVLLGGDPKKKNFLYCCGNSVFIRNLQNPLECDMYTEHQVNPTVARYAPSGFYICSADASGKVRIWDTINKEHVLKIELQIIAGPIFDVQWSEDSKRVVAVGEGREKYGSVFLWDSGSSVGEISGHSKAILSCDFKQTRPYRIVTGAEDPSANWFEGPPFKFKKSLKDHTRFINCVRFAPDGSKFLTVGSDKKGFLYDGKTGEKVGELSEKDAHTGGIYACSWSPDSKKVLTASADKTCKLWDAESGQCLTTFKFSDSVDDQQLGCLWQGDDLISISLNGNINYLDVDNPEKPKRIIRGHNKIIKSVAYDPETKSLFTSDYGANIIQWDLETGQNYGFSGQGHTNQIKKVKVQGGNIVSCSMDDSIRITNKESKEYGSESVSFDSEPVDIAVGKKDQSLVIGVITDSVVVLRNGKLAGKTKVNFQPISVSLSADETEVAVGGKDKQIHIYSLSGDSLSEKKVIKGHTGEVTAVEYSPDGTYLGSACADRRIFLWDAKTGEEKVSGWQFHAARITCLSWAPDSLHLVSGSIDSHLYVWSVEQTNKRIFIKDAHRGGVSDVTFVDSNTVASVGQDCCLKTWALTY